MPKRYKVYLADRHDRAAILLLARIVVCIAVFAACNRAQEPTNSQSTTSSVNKSEAAVDLSADQLHSIKIEPVGTYAFAVETRTIGSIDFDNKLYFDNALAVQVFPPSEGTIVDTLAELGDPVQKDQPLYIISTPKRSRLNVRSPIAGQITSVNATKGLLVQPGKAPAPYAVADVSTKWMVASVLESDSPSIEVDQPVDVRVAAYPDRVFDGKVARLYPTVDPNTHRVTVRATIADPANELRAGMLASILIHVKSASEWTALPEKAIVREPDGTMTVWVTSDRHRFTQKIVQTGLRQRGEVQILGGIERGDLVVTDGAVFLSNMLQAPPSD